jgi:hypothetical protein
MSQIAALTEESSDERATLAALFTEFLKVSRAALAAGWGGPAARSSTSDIG